MQLMHIHIQPNGLMAAANKGIIQYQTENA